MRKKIALILGEITGSFQETIMRAAVKRANELDYDTVSFCTYGSYNNDVQFANGEKACAHIMNYGDFDGIIVSEDLFDIEGMGDEIYATIINEAKCPIVYTRTEREGCFSIFVENKESIKKMTNHFIKDHGFTDICFMSGKKGTSDAEERLAGFMEAMEEAGLKVGENSVFHGDFWREKGKVAVDYFLSGRDKYPEAIICANDFMALSVIDELRDRNIRVPDDICVSGFDYVEEAKVHQPSITTLNVDFVEMAVEAVNIIDRVNMANHQERKTYIQPELILHNSCGCGEQFICTNIPEMLRENYNSIYTMKNIMLSTTEYQDALDLDECLEVADRYFDILRTKKAWLCLCDNGEDGNVNSQLLNSFPEKMVLKCIFRDGVDAEKLNVQFDRKNLLPEEYMKEEDTRNLVVFSIHFKNRIYGYIATKFPEDGEKWYDIYSQAYIADLATAIENTMIQNQLASFEELKMLYQTDSLTGFYNRRGFDKLSVEMHKEAVDKNKNLIFVSIDMDSLKFINETYGHTEGDRAIKKMADAIRRSVSEDDLVARVGGDEFYILFEETRTNNKDTFLDNLNYELDRINNEMSNFAVSASVGVSTLKENPNYTTQSLMQLADMRMYDDKRSKNSGLIPNGNIGTIDWSRL